MSNRNIEHKSFVLATIFLSISLILSYVEVILPINIGYVGIKIGLSNIITILALKLLSIRETLIINILRLLIIGILFGNLVRFLLSISGFVLSFIVILVLLKRLNFSIIVSSIYGAIFHNIGQIIALTIIIKNIEILKIIPIYVGFGVISGLIVGFVSDAIYRKISKVSFE